MSDDIETEMRATYSASKRWWRGVVALWVVSIALAGATQLPLPDPLPVIATALSFLFAVAAFGVRWRADALYQTAEGLRRVKLLADGLGETSDPAELARIRASASERASGDPAPIGAYYTSERGKGWHRVLHNVQESAFYTETIARRTAWICTIAVATGLVLAIVALFVAVNLTDDVVSRVMGNVVMGGVVSIISGTLADLARAYFALSRAATECFDRSRLLLSRAEVPLRDALRTMDSYDAALANAPPLPGLVYRSMQKRLDALWKEVRSTKRAKGKP
jgi:hypothetical protein